MLLQACLNGSRSKDAAARIPITAEELARDAVAVRAVGAAPGMPIGVETGAWIEPKFAARLNLIRDWKILPDCASVNFCEDDAPENAERMMSKGVGIEAGIWSVSDAGRFIEIPFARKYLRVLAEMLVDDPMAARDEYSNIMAILKDAKIELPILPHGEGESVWPMVRLAASRGHDIRVGFENTPKLPDGTSAINNKEIVHAAERELSVRRNSL